MTDIGLTGKEEKCDSCGFDQSRMLIVMAEQEKVMNLCPVCARTLQWQLQDSLAKYHSKSQYE